jgi:hypothetical protein
LKFYCCKSDDVVEGDESGAIVACGGVEASGSSSNSVIGTVATIRNSCVLCSSMAKVACSTHYKMFRQTDVWMDEYLAL